MNRIEKIISEYPDIYFEFEELPIQLGGLNINEQITINSSKTEEEQYQWLCEEIGHFKSSSGEITDYSSTKNMQQETKARKIGMKICVPKERLLKIISNVPENDYEVAEELNVNLDYLHNVASMYGIGRSY